MNIHGNIDPATDDVNMGFRIVTEVNAILIGLAISPVEKRGMQSHRLLPYIWGSSDRKNQPTEPNWILSAFFLYRAPPRM